MQDATSEKAGDTVLQTNRCYCQLFKDGLSKYWSPEQISERMRLDRHETRVCFKTIYRWLKAGSYAGEGTIFADYASYLRIESRGKSLRRRPGGKRRVSEALPSIADRPADETFGHWEIDLIHGKNRSGYLLSAVERSTGFWALGLCPKKDVLSVQAAMRRIFSPYPKKISSQRDL